MRILSVATYVFFLWVSQSQITGGEQKEGREKRRDGPSGASHWVEESTDNNERGKGKKTQHAVGDLRTWRGETERHEESGRGGHGEGERERERERERDIERERERERETRHRERQTQTMRDTNHGATERERERVREWEREKSWHGEPGRYFCLAAWGAGYLS